MAITIVSTPGASNANSYLEVSEADTYFEGRVALDPAWGDTDNDQKIAQLVMATRLLDSLLRGQKTLVRPMNGQDAYYVIGRKWTGAPATTTQKLAWPRSGMYDQNGNAIAETVIPDALKDATAEFAGQLGISDRSLDYDVAVQGITSVKAGSVAVTFRDGHIATFTLPQAVIDLLVPSWYTEELDEGVSPFMFDVV